MKHVHEGQSLVQAGESLERADAAVIMLHGRGATAQGILSLMDEIDLPNVAYVAPQARGLTWYPHSFLAPLDSNEPDLSSALRSVDDAFRFVEGAGMRMDQTILLGFSQGACLALEYAARHPRFYGGVVGLSGGLIGTKDRPGVRPPSDKDFDYSGSFDGTPIFVGCSDVDPHIPLVRVKTSVDVLKKLGADVTERIYPAMPHTINEDEIRVTRAMIAQASTEGAASSN